MHYPWGGRRFLPELLGIPNPSRQPFTEYWLGAHPKAPSTVIASGDRHARLDELIRSDPEKWLGSQNAARFGEFPFLFKLLDVDQPLSIQVHPDRRQAKRGFERENRLGIPLDDPRRNFKDPNHKPEFLLALDDFRLLYGLLTDRAMEQRLRTVPELAPLLKPFEASVSTRGQVSILFV